MPPQNAIVRLAKMAGRQRGRVTWAQLCAVADASTVRRWSRDGYLHLVLPGVYAVGHRSPDPVADLAAALLYAGPGAALSHGTAAWWLGLIDDKPLGIHISTPRRVNSIAHVVVHGRRRFERVMHKGLAITTVAQVLLDLASTAPDRYIRRALANADFRGWLNLEAIEEMLGRGRPGSARLRGALIRHQPSLARTNSGLEILLVELCERDGIPVPEVNAWVAGWSVDALWREQRVAVELDGARNHRSPAQVRRDRRKDMDLRAAGFVPLRYSDEQIEHHWSEVLIDMRRAGAPIPPEPSA